MELDITILTAEEFQKLLGEARRRIAADPDYQDLQARLQNGERLLLAYCPRHYISALRQHFKGHFHYARWRGQYVLWLDQ